MLKLAGMLSPQPSSRLRVSLDISDDEAALFGDVELTDAVDVVETVLALATFPVEFGRLCKG
jgi:hypothetical protein